MSKNSKKIVDTNIIIRFLVEDQAEQLNQAKTWFSQAREGELNLVIEPIVVAESCYVLESFYKIKKSEIAEKFQILLGQRWLQVNQRKVLENLWPFYLDGLHFVDSFLLSWSRVHGQSILSFDQGLIKAIELPN